MIPKRTNYYPSTAIKSTIFLLILLKIFDIIKVPKGKRKSKKHFHKQTLGKSFRTELLNEYVKSTKSYKGEEMYRAEVLSQGSETLTKFFKKKS